MRSHSALVAMGLGNPPGSSAACCWNNKKGKKWILVIHFIFSLNFIQLRAPADALPFLRGRDGW
jgi:hypothetical protein